MLDNTQIKNKNEQDDNNDNNEDVSAEESVTQADDFETVLLPFLKTVILFTA